MAETKKLTDLTHDTRNANRGTARGAKAIKKSLADYGAGRSVLIDRHGNLIAGNKTVEGARAIGIEDVIVVPTDGTKLVAVQRTDLDLSDPKARKLAYMDNRAGQLSLDWDPEQLSQDLEAGLDLGDCWDEAELAELLGSASEEAGGLLPDADPDAVPEDVETRVQPGELWELGRHRLICASSTDAEAVAKLFGDDRLRLVWTDPPYGVDYGAKDQFLAAHGKSRGHHRPIENDAMTPEETGALCQEALALAAAHAVPGAAAYIACPAGPLLAHFIAAMSGAGFDYRHGLVWVKDQFVLGRCDYHYRHEPILYGWLDGAHYFVDERTHDSVFEVPRPKANREHPTMKPVELVARMIRNSSREGEIVYDCFSGSGSTLIAAEQEGRTFRGCELDPKYASVILARWEAATGGTARRIAAGQDLRQVA